ncbi:MAG: diguanylate cyclase [Spirochaetes bacterium]|nr:diguanylate cyclase [Spirochaetota bacterium]
MRILVIEDDQSQRMLLSGLLLHNGHEVIEAATGAEAWDVIASGGIRVLIVDRLLPDIDGLSLLRRIRSVPLPGYVYAIVITSVEGRDSLLESLDAGADDYIAKPFDKSELVARLKIGERILRLETRLTDLAKKDYLTELLNRYAFIKQAEIEFDRARRENSRFGLIMMDLDHFKLVNDRHGHLAGDETLKLVADTLRCTCRPYDIICRWGGEEFLILTPGCDLTNTARTAERLRAVLPTKAVGLPGGGSVSVTGSFGVVAYVPGADDEVADMIGRADEALYDAKNAGRNAVRTA